jgi:hypothetical protein
MIILDTDHISVLQHEDSPKTVVLLEKLERLPPEEVATTVATLEEQSRSWLSLIGRYSDVRLQVAYYDRLKGMFEFFAGWQVIPGADMARLEELRELTGRIHARSADRSRIGRVGTLCRDCGGRRARRASVRKRVGRLGLSVARSSSVYSDQDPLDLIQRDLVCRSVV